MTFEEKFKAIAAQLEDLRVEFFQNIKTSDNEDEILKNQVSDRIFSIQSELHYDIAVSVAYLE